MEKTFAIVKATKKQLEEIDINEDLTDKKVIVYDIDQYSGLVHPCSKIIIDSQFEWVKKLNPEIDLDYIIPTIWLKILK